MQMDCQQNHGKHIQLHNISSSFASEFMTKLGNAMVMSLKINNTRINQEAVQSFDIEFITT